MHAPSWGARVQATLRRLCLSQAAFCRAIDVDYTTFYRWQKAGPDRRIRKFVTHWLTQALLVQHLADIARRGGRFVEISEVLYILEHPECHYTDHGACMQLECPPAWVESARVPHAPCANPDACPHWQRSQDTVALHPHHQHCDGSRALDCNNPARQ